MESNEKQKERFKNLLNLVEDNPELRIVPMVDSDIVADSGYTRWTGSWGRAEVTEVYLSNERVYVRSNDEVELQEEYEERIYLTDYPKLDTLTKEQDNEIVKKAEEAVNKLQWEKVIVVYIDLP